MLQATRSTDMERVSVTIVPEMASSSAPTNRFFCLAANVPCAWEAARALFP